MVRARGLCDTATRLVAPWAACALWLVAGSWARTPSTPWEQMASCLRATSCAMTAGKRCASRTNAHGMYITQSYPKSEATLPWHISIVRDTRQGRYYDEMTFQRHVSTRLMTAWVVPCPRLRYLAARLTA